MKTFCNIPLEFVPQQPPNYEAIPDVAARAGNFAGVDRLHKGQQDRGQVLLCIPFIDRGAVFMTTSCFYSKTATFK